MPVTTEDFQRALQERLQRAESQGERWLVVRAGDLHEDTGAQNRMPMSCGAMVAAMKPGDVVVESPPSGQGANLTVFYWLPRARH